MQDILNASVLCRIASAIGRWFGKQWEKSVVITAFLSPCRGEEIAQGSAFYKLWRVFHGLLCTIFEKLRFNRLFEGSVFQRSYLWCALAVVLAPIVPTKALLLLAAVAMGSMVLRFGCERQRQLAFSPFNRFIVLYAFVYCATIFTSVTISGSLYGGVLTVFFILTALLIQNAVRTQKQLDTLILMMILAAILVSLYGIYQYVFGISGTSSWLDDDMFSSISLRVYSTLQNPNVLSEYLLLIIPFSAAGVLTAKSLQGKVGYAMAFLVMCLCMVLTFSRGGWLGLLFAGAVFLVLLDRRFLLLGLVALVGLYFVLPETVIDRFTSIGDLSDSSTSYRVYIWMATIDMLKHYWLCGIGPGTAAFNMVYPAYSYNAVAAPHAHNVFLQIMCDCGVCGLILFVVIIFLFFRMTSGALVRETDRDSRIKLMAAISACCGFMVQSMTDYSFYNYRVMFLFWAFLGMGALLARRSKLPEGGKLF